MSKDNSKHTFIEITNKDIYDAINSLKELNAREHNEIVKRLDFTNGKVKLAKWIGTTALSLVIIAIGFILRG